MNPSLATMMSTTENIVKAKACNFSTHQQRSEDEFTQVRVVPRQRTRKCAFRATVSIGTQLALLLIALLCSQVSAWGNSGSGEVDYSIYGNGFTRDWLYDGSTLSFQVLGCVWGMVEDSEEAGCLEDESEDGTYNWYMMANCRRPQVAYSVYTSSGCNSNNFAGSVRTKEDDLYAVFPRIAFFSLTPHFRLPHTVHDDCRSFRIHLLATNIRCQLCLQWWWIRVWSNPRMLWWRQWLRRNWLYRWSVHTQLLQRSILHVPHGQHLR